MNSIICLEADYPVEERCFWTYMSERLESVNNCYISKVQDDNRIGLLRKQVDRFETYEELVGN